MYEYNTIYLFWTLYKSIIMFMCKGAVSNWDYMSDAIFLKDSDGLETLTSKASECTFQIQESHMFWTVFWYHKN